MHLIVGKEEELKRALADLLRGCNSPITHFYRENFTADSFSQEVETAPFLSKTKGVVINGVDQLTDEEKEALRCYLEKPAPWVELYLTAETLSAQTKISKMIEKKGKVIRFKEEKPWEKEKRLAAWLIEEAKRESVRLAPQTASLMVQSLDANCLKSELEKLICFAGQKKEITSEDFSLISTPIHHETLWQLGDALFAGDAARALTISKSLLEEGMALIPLLASLRSQCVTAKGILEAAEKGEVAEKYPYLKGQLLEKKLKLLKKMGRAHLTRALLLIFETEVQAKNSQSEPELLLELLIVKIIYDTLSVA